MSVLMFNPPKRKAHKMENPLFDNPFLSPLLTNKPSRFSRLKSSASAMKSAAMREANRMAKESGKKYAKAASYLGAAWDKVKGAMPKVIGRKNPYLSPLMTNPMMDNELMDNLAENIADNPKLSTVIGRQLRREALAKARAAGKMPVTPEERALYSKRAFGTVAKYKIDSALKSLGIARGKKGKFGKKKDRIKEFFKLLTFDPVIGAKRPGATLPADIKDSGMRKALTAIYQKASGGKSRIPAKKMAEFVAMIGTTLPTSEYKKWIKRGTIGGGFESPSQVVGWDEDYLAPSAPTAPIVKSLKKAKAKRKLNIAQSKDIAELTKILEKHYSADERLSKWKNEVAGMEFQNAIAKARDLWGAEVNPPLEGSVVLNKFIAPASAVFAASNIIEAFDWKGRIARALFGTPEEKAAEAVRVKAVHDVNNPFMSALKYNVSTIGIAAGLGYLVQHSDKEWNFMRPANQSENKVLIWGLGIGAFFSVMQDYLALKKDLVHSKRIPAAGTNMVKVQQSVPATAQPTQQMSDYMTIGKDQVSDYMTIGKDQVSDYMTIGKDQVSGMDDIGENVYENEEDILQDVGEDIAEDDEEYAEDSDLGDIEEGDSAYGKNVRRKRGRKKFYGSRNVVSGEPTQVEQQAVAAPAQPVAAQTGRRRKQVESTDINMELLMANRQMSPLTNFRD